MPRYAARRRHDSKQCERNKDASNSDTVIFPPDNTRLKAKTFEKISTKNLKELKKKSNVNQLKPSNPGTCTESSTGCAASSSQSAPKTILPKNLNKKNGKGETCLHLACKKKDLAAVKAVIQASIDVNTEDYSGWTALHSACVSGNVAIVKELLKAGANVNARDANGLTPLHDAVGCGHYEVVKCLLHCGSNPHDKNIGGLSALDMAEEETIKELLSAFQPPAQICESHCDKSSNYQSSATSSTSDTANVRSRESGDTARAREPDDIHWRKKDTITDNLCGSKDFAVVLGKVDTNQTKLSFWPLSGAANMGRYETVLKQTLILLAELLAKQCLEKDYVTQKCQRVSSSLCQCLTRSQLNSLISHQRDLVRFIQRQMELVEAYMAVKTLWSTQSTSKHQPDRCANPMSSSPFSTIRQSDSDNRASQSVHSHTPVTQDGLKGQGKPGTPVTLPTQVNKAPIQTDVLKKKDTRPLQDASQPANMPQVSLETNENNTLIQMRAEDQNRHLSDLLCRGLLPSGSVLQVLLKDVLHFCSVRMDGVIQDCNGKLYQAPEHWLESILGNNISVSSSYAWNMVTYKDKPLSHYLLHTETEEDSAQTQSVEEHQQYSICSTRTSGQLFLFDDVLKASLSLVYTLPFTNKEVTDSLNCLMKIKTIRLVPDDEILPNAVMDVYWNKLLRNDSNNWGFE